MSEENNEMATDGQADDAGKALFGGDGGNGQGGEAVNGQTPEVKESKGQEEAAPVDGKYDLKMPDGVEVDADLAAAFGGEFKELGLSNAQAQRLVDKYIEAQTQRMERQGEKWGETVSGWIDEAKADQEIGGHKWDESVSAGRLAVEKFGTPALRDYLNASGGGNHPEMIRFMAKVGSLLREDNPARGGGGGGAVPQEAAHILFENDVKQ